MINQHLGKPPVVVLAKKHPFYSAAMRGERVLYSKA